MTAKFAQYITQEDKGFRLEIAVNEQFEGVNVQSITMYIARESEDGFYMDGDLAVNWDTEGLTDNADADTMGTLLLRNINSDDDITRVMGEFYWQHGFDKRLQQILIAAGFSKDAATVSGSEWGMQDEGRASYDAYTLADEVRAAFAVA